MVTLNLNQHNLWQKWKSHLIFWFIVWNSEAIGHFNCTFITATWKVHKFTYTVISYQASILYKHRILMPAHTVGKTQTVIRLAPV